MAAVNGHANGHINGFTEKMGGRFSHIPRTIDIPVQEGVEDEAVEVDLVDLIDDPTELCTLLENEHVDKNLWMTIAMAYAKQKKVDTAIEILNRSLGALTHGKSTEKLMIMSAICWMYLWKCREAPRLKQGSGMASDAKTKENYIHEATQIINEAARISPAYSPFFLNRGVLSLLRASQPLSAKGPQNKSEQTDVLIQGLKSFEDALRASANKNMMAMMGKARVQFALGKYPDALQTYQHVLERAPDIVDPDPRVGIGCCLWQLDHKDAAHSAWERAIEVNPDSAIAKTLLGLYHLQHSSQFPITDPRFVDSYKKGISDYITPAWKTSIMMPLPCVTLGSYFLTKGKWDQAEKLALRTIEMSDTNPVISDGWYLRARKEHYAGSKELALDYYQKSDAGRGGDEAGYLPAKFGIAQIKVLMGDLSDAKYRLEKLVQTAKIPEAMSLLGTLYAEEAFSAVEKEDRSTEAKKASSLLEAVRNSWRDPKKNARPDVIVLLNLARLYENDQPDKSFQCLQQVEKIQLDMIPESAKPVKEEDQDEAAFALKVKEMLPPQLLNNMGCFQYQHERYAEARELFQTSLKACVNIRDTDSTIDTDALVTTISFNLARTYEAEGMASEAKEVYDGLLQRHDDYLDANARLAYISLKEDPAGKGAAAIKELYKSASRNMEVMALYGWYLHKAKKRTANLAEDSEQRHYKRSLNDINKHDVYSLTAMGNIHLMVAREMRRDTDQDKDKRRKIYERSVEFFDKALSLDPKNAYAAQGIGIAIVEDRHRPQDAVQIFQKVREAIKDASVFLNLGHVYTELKQYARAIENYENALAKERSRDYQILSCLGRVWLMRGKQEKSLEAMKTSLDFTRSALAIAPEHAKIQVQFNVAFVQIQIAQLIYTLPDKERSLADVEAAASGLDEAIESFSAIAKSPAPPFPKNDIEQRANMGRNTMRKQLERAAQNQREYEDKNADRLAKAKEMREAEIRRREDEKRKIEEAKADERRKVAEERHRMQERDRELAEHRAEEERKAAEAEMTEDSDGNRVKRTKRKPAPRKRKQKGTEDTETEAGGSDDEGLVSGTPATGDEAVEREKPKKKKRKLERKSERKSKAQSKYKSSEMVVESDEDEVMVDAADTAVPDEDDAEIGEVNEGAGDEVPAAASQARKKANRIVDDDEDEDEE
ncbi:TPR-like protein [Aulographum hederae CBS 113979]|uniref:TPR-like protein n=1 Tax=Aulographum hederae CBS 113979 TaxID=1176131 RepID=A0A6G1GYU6_9PEZI|nr:TPR-like protein [Aulographum hederae CBS 113979]